MALSTGNPYIDALGGATWGPGHYPDPDGALILTVYFDNDTSAGHSTGGAWTTAEESAFRDALHAWESVANIRFHEVQKAKPDDPVPTTDLVLRKVNTIPG